MESEMKKDDGFAVTYTTGDVPTYTSAHYTTEMHGYYTDIDWQNGSLDPSRSMYTRQEMPTIPFYPGYQTVTHADIYPGSNLWHSADNSLQVAADANISHTINVRRENARSGTTSTGRPKRRRTQSLTQRRAANVRERRRMFQLNEAFDALRKKLPAFNYEKRLSRIETLRLAMTYISFMQEVTTGADPKHVKLLSYQTEDSNHAHDLSLHQNGCHSPISENDIDIGIHGEHVVENVTLTPVDVQPQSELKELQSVSAVHVELLPSVPVKISLPATNLEVLTEEPPQSFAEEQSVSDE